MAMIVELSHVTCGFETCQHRATHRVLTQWLERVGDYCHDHAVSKNAEVRAQEQLERRMAKGRR